MLWTHGCGEQEPSVLWGMSKTRKPPRQAWKSSQGQDFTTHPKGDFPAGTGHSLSSPLGDEAPGRLGEKGSQASGGDRDIPAGLCSEVLVCWPAKKVSTRVSSCKRPLETDPHYVSIQPVSLGICKCDP